MVHKEKSRRPEADLDHRRSGGARARSRDRSEQDEREDAEIKDRGAALWATHDEELPYRAGMERSFGRSLEGISVQTGMDAELAPLGAQAIADGNRIAFADHNPSPGLVAHEVTHVIQNQNAGQSSAMAAGVVAPRDSDAESEAEGAAALVDAHGPGVALPEITARPGAGVQRAPRAPVVRVDRKADAEELRTATLAKDKATIFAVLQRNANPEYMYALCAQLPGIASRLHIILTENEWARARAYLGEQVALDLQLETHDKDAMFRDLHELADQRALDLFTGASGGQVFVPPQAVDKNQPAPTHAPAATTLAAVQQVLRSKLDGNDYAKAMRLLLDKADRAMNTRSVGIAPPGIGPNDFTLTLDDIRLDPNNPNASVVVLMQPGLDPISAQRVDLAEQRIRAADQDGNSAQAFLSLTDLDLDERKALGARLRDKPLAKATDLSQLADQTDDATMLQTAFVRARYEQNLTKKAAAGIDHDTAVARIGELVRTARMKLDTMSPNAPEAERKHAQDELRRLETMFFGDSREAIDVRQAVQTATGGDPKAYGEQLRAMGADPVTVGKEMLNLVWDTNIDGIIDVLKLIPVEHRSAAVKASKHDFPGLRLGQDKRELLNAYLEQGRRAEPLDPALHGTPTIVDPQMTTAGGLVIFDVGPSPEATIALFEILEAMDRGPFSANFVLSRLSRLHAIDHKSVVTDPRFKTKLANLPTGNIDEQDFKTQVTNATGSPRAAEVAILHYPSGPEHPGQHVRLEEARLKTEEAGGQAKMRRAYVLEAQIAEDPTLEQRLPFHDKVLLDDYKKIAATKTSLDNDAQRTNFDEITLGQPQLGDTPQAALDPNTEAEYMRVRLHKAAKVPTGKSLSGWAHDRPAVTEALNQFEALYIEARPAGVSRSDLALLADIYYRALHEIDEWNKALAENEGLAKLAAMVAGVVVAVAVTALTGGALGPIAVGALAAISAGTASAVAGAAVRWEDTTGTVFTDFGTGAVEGIATVAGAGLAARVVRGASAGVSAGRAAVEAGGKAARVGGTVASTVAEAAIDGAVGGAAGELFQTAVDEATWDRGVGEAMAKMLAALVRGAAIGAASGGAVGGLIGGLGRLAARSSPEVAHGVAHLLDSSGAGRKAIDNLPDAEHVELAHAYELIEAGQLDKAEEVIRRIHGMPAKARAMFIEAARARAAIRTSPLLESVDINGESYWPRILDDKEFKAMTGGQRAHAVVVVENGKPVIYARRGAPPQAIREEVIHVHQFYGDVAMRQRMERISQENLAGFDGLKPEDKLRLHVDKLEVEADAQRRIINQLEHEVVEDPDAAMRVMDAEENLFLLSQRLDKLRNVKPGAWIDVKGMGLDEAPHLFSKAQHTGSKVTGARAAKARRSFIGKNIDNKTVQKELEAQGYVVHRDGMTGEIFRITRHPDSSAKLPHLQLEGRTIKEGEGVATFAERKAAAGAEWRDSQKMIRELQKDLKDGDLIGDAAKDARVLIKSKGPQLRSELERRVVNNLLDDESAGLVAKWGGVAEKLASDARGSYKFTLKDFIDQLPADKTYTEAHVDKLRQYLRKQTLDYIESLKRPKDRMEALHEMLDVQPDPGSKGELFHAYRERFMGPNNGVYETADESAKKFSGAGLSNSRTPDGVATVHDHAKALLPPGSYAVEDKAGDGAFKLEQARDYAKRAYEKAGGFKLTPNAKHAEYDGLVYVFSRKSEADAALEKMEEVPTIKKVLGRDTAGIHVMYFNADTGELARATDRVAKKPTRK